MEARKGTTTVGVLGKDVVVLAADKQASMGDIALDLRAKKIYPISKYMALTTAGLVGDAQMLVRFLKARVKRMEIEEGKHPNARKVASFLATVLNANRMFPFWVELLFGAYVEKPEIYSIDAVGGVGEVKDYTATGSGTPFAIAVLEAGYKENLSEEEAVKLAVKAIEVARRREVFTGGREPGIDVAVITKEGVRMLSEKEVEKIKKTL